ncbi:MAG: PEP-CTERM sorting domain-containing protein [Rhodocyclaceae bacterium]|nr:PEP-CTERM sorting domain-containing protein [Rhodocyclaceae bacterium]
MKTKRISHTLLASAALLVFASSAGAAVVQTFGSGSAVSTITNSADFELNLTLSTPYSEGGMVFTYNGSANNNGCGYAGCTFHPGFFPGFSGNYMYSVGTNTFISITMGNGSDFSAIEFAAGTGYGVPINGYWQTYNNSVLTGFGNFTTAGVDVLGLADSSGFDEVRYFAFSSPDLQTGYSAPAIDTVRAGAGGNSVPEPASLALLGIGLAGLSALRRRKV